MVDFLTRVLLSELVSLLQLVKPLIYVLRGPDIGCERILCEDSHKEDY